MAISEGKKRGRPAREELAEERRAQILCVAMRVFARDGFQRTDLQRVADELGVGKGTVYRYFETKEALFLAAVDRAMQKMRAALDAAVDPASDPLDQIAAAVRAYLEFFETHPDYVELIIQERAAFRERKKPTYFVNREANAGRWRAIYERLMDEGRMRRMPAERITEVLGDLAYGTMFTNYFVGRSGRAREQAQAILDIIFHGILAPGAAGPGANGQEQDR